MATTPLPSVDVLRQLVHVDAKTGAIIWKERDISLFKSQNPAQRKADHQRWNDRFSGKPAFTQYATGNYRNGKLMGTLVRAHVIVWAYFNGEWPTGHIDHVNRDPSDNRIENLRLCTRSQNQANTPKRKHSKSPYKGVSFNKARRKWIASIQHCGVKIYLGAFDTSTDAAKAYDKAATGIYEDFAHLNFPNDS